VSDEQKKKISFFQEKINGGDTEELMTKKVVIFSGKIGMTPAVAAPSNTHPSDATGLRGNVCCSSRGSLDSAWWTLY